MKSRNTLAAVALTVIMAAPAANWAQAGRPAKIDQLMRETVTAASRAGAMKRKLLEEVPMAKRRYKEIQKLRREIEKLNKEIDEVLAGESSEYRKLLKAKEEAAEKYKKAKKAEADKAKK
ncbi:MAG: hypothetical protein R6V56_01730 [Lentisphaeria bacterium]